MTTALAPARPGAAPGRATFTALAIREMRRLALNPVFLFAVAITVYALWVGPGTVTDIDTADPYWAIFLGGFGMMATYWLTRSMRASEPVLGVSPTTLQARTAALCAVALVPFACGCLALLRFVQLIPVSNALYGPFSPSARVAVLVGQIAVPALGGPLIGVALGRWVRFPGAAFVLFLILYGWVSLVTILSMSHPDSAPVAVLRLFAPFAFFTSTGDAGGVYFTSTEYPSNGLARVAVVLHRLAARPVRDRGPGGAAARGRGAGTHPDHPRPRHRSSDGPDLARAGRHRRVHPHGHRVMTGLVLRAGAWPTVAGISGLAVVVGGGGAAFPAAATMLLPICFTLLAAAAAFTLDEPASLVVDVTPTGPVRRTRIRAMALLAPLAVGSLVMLAAAMRGLALPWAAAGLALAGNVVLGFATACVVRTRKGNREQRPVPPSCCCCWRPVSCRRSRAGSARSRRPTRAGRPPTPCGGSPSRCVWWPSLFRSVAEGCLGGCPGLP